MIILRKEFSDDDDKDKKKKNKISLSKVKSDTGLKRAIITSIPTGFGSLVGGYLSKDAANKADMEGYSDDEILARAKKRGGISGAVTGGVGGLLVGAENVARTGNPHWIISNPVVGAGLGFIGGREAARVNTEDRLLKRAYLERE